MKKKFMWVIVAAIAIGAVFGCWWLFATGRLVYVSSGSQTNNNGNVVVCGSDVVDRYNGAALLIKRQGSDTPSVDKEGLKALASDIRNRKDYTADATCQTILFWVAVQSDDYKAALTASKAVENLHEKRNFADSNIRNNDAIFNYKTYLNSLTGSGGSKEETWGE